MKKYSFSISNLKPDTLSAPRLAEYIRALTDLVGKKYSEKLHLYEVQEGSAQPVFAVEDDIEMDFVRELYLIGTGNVSVGKKKALQNLNQLLREDNSTGEFLVTGSKASIIKFPGVNQESPIPEYRTTSLMPIILKGVLYKVGGADNSIPFGISLAGENFTGNVTSQDLAKEMARYLYETIEVHGLGHWIIDKNAVKRKLKDFVVTEFRPLRDSLPFDDALTRLADHPDNRWSTLRDPIETALKIRDE
jgi:hypothetical protein